MLQTVSIRGFKSLANVEVELSRLTALVGPNGSGKTSFLQGLECFSFLFLRGLRERLNKTSLASLINQNAGFPGLGFKCSWLANGSKGELEIDLSPAITGGDVYVVRFAGLEDNKPFTYSFTAVDGASDSPIPAEAFLSRHNGFVRAAPSDFAIPSTSLLSLDARAIIKKPTEPREAPYRIEPDGTGVTAVLADAKLTRPSEFDALQASLRRIIPVIKSIALIGAQEGEGSKEAFPGQALRFETVSAKSVGAAALSEGSLLVLGILAVLIQRDRPKLILLDDVERGLHPKAVGDLVAHLRQILKDNPDLQIVVTSHSPYLLDHLEPSEVRLTHINQDGSVSIAKLEDHPDFARWKDVMTTGEFWSHVGEDWVPETKAEKAGAEANG